MKIFILYDKFVLIIFKGLFKCIQKDKFCGEKKNTSITCARVILFIKYLKS